MPYHVYGMPYHVYLSKLNIIDCTLEIKENNTKTCNTCPYIIWALPLILWCLSLILHKILIFLKYCCQLEVFASHPYSMSYIIYIYIYQSWTFVYKHLHERLTWKSRLSFSYMYIHQGIVHCKLILDMFGKYHGIKVVLFGS
jgi:hypothetical protein